MKSDFYFSSIEIKNFRGIREMNLPLSSGKPLHIIGSNNAGKSTVLEAIAFALKGGGFHQYQIDPFDFYKLPDGTSATEFSITLFFQAEREELLPAVQGAGNPQPVHGLQVKGKTDKSGRHSHRHLLIDGEGNAITYSPRTTLRGEKKESYKGRDNLGWRTVYARLDDIRKDLPDVWLLTPQNLNRSLYDWKTGPLQRLSKMLAQNFLSSEWEFKYGEQTREMPESLIKAHRFFKAAVEAFPFWQDDLRPRLESTLRQYVGNDAELHLSPDVLALNDWLTQQLAVSFAAQTGGTLTPIRNMGDGWQSLIRLAAMDALSQYPEQTADKVVVLAEEPETHLHPHLRRKMRDVLAKLAENGWSVVTATHSPELISFANPQKIIRLARIGSETEFGEFDTSDAADAIKFQERLDERGCHELLSARKVILCEGSDDRWALRSLIPKFDNPPDIDALSVSIIAVGGVGNLPVFAEIASMLKIPWMAIHDEDKLDDGTIKPETKTAVEALNRHKSKFDEIAYWKGDLERCLDAPKKAKWHWQVDNSDGKSLKELMSDHPYFVSVGQSALDWIRES